MISSRIPNFLSKKKKLMNKKTATEMNRWQFFGIYYEFNYSSVTITFFTSQLPAALSDALLIYLKAIRTLF